MARTFFKGVTTASAPSNNVYEMWFELKEHLKSAGWTVESSSDGTTFNSSGDEITGAIGGGANNFQNARSWYRIRSPAGAGSHEFVVQTENFTAGQQLRVKYSRTAGFTGGTPGATETPSATDEVFLCGGGTDGAPTTAVCVDGSIRRFFIHADDASPYGFAMASWINGSPGNGGGGSMWLDPIVSGTGLSGDAAQEVLYLSDGTGNSYLAAQLGDQSDTAAQPNECTQGYVHLGEAGEGFENIPMQTYCHDGAGFQTFPGNGGQNPFDSDDYKIPIAYSRSNNESVTNPQWKGISSLFGWKGTSRTTGDTLSLSAPNARDFIIVGDLVTFWDGTVPVL